MKKIGCMLLVLVCLLSLHGAAMASQCEHNVRCTDRTTCIWCPEKNITTYEWVTHDYEYTDLGEKHQSVCKDCGDEGGSGQHTVYCTDPDYCTVCKLTVTDFPAYMMIHNGSVVCLNAEEHQWQCLACGYARDKNVHYGYCGAPDTCDYCDATGVTIQESKIRHSYGYVSVGEQHEQKCEVCGKVTGTYDHRVKCSASDTCYDCGQTGLTIPAEDQSHSFEAVNLGTQHQYQCKNCDFAREPADHYAKCTAPDVCSACGATGLNLPVEQLSHSMKWVDLGAQHQRQCKNCDYATEPAEHSAKCTEPDVCTNCKATGLTIPENRLRHEWDYVNIGTQHQRQCALCGMQQEAEDHVARCNDLSVCVVCKAELASVDEQHIVHKGELVNLGDTHRFECEYCGYTFEGDHFVLCEDPTVCIDCEAAGLSVSESLIECIGPFSYAPLSAAEHRRTCGTCGRTQDSFHTCEEGETCICGMVVEDRLAGDATGDDSVTIEDAIAILQYASGENVGIDLYNADVTGDGQVDLFDVLRILQYDAGWDVTLE